MPPIDYEGVVAPDLEPSLSKIFAFFADKERFNEKAFYGELVQAYVAFTFQQSLVSGTHAGDGKYPRTGELKTFLADTMSEISKQIRWLKKNYLADIEVGEKDAPYHLTKQTVIGPNGIQALYSGLVAAQRAGIELRLAIPEDLPTGPDPAPFTHLIQNLSRLYEKHSGETVTTSSFQVGDPGEPTDFQRFARVCSKAFGFKAKKSFYRKVHITMGELRKLQILGPYKS